MNPPSPFAADGPILGLSGQENPALPPGTPRVETSNRQSTLEDRMETLQREMIKMQEHNHILSSKLDDTQKQLHKQESRSAQPPRGLEQTRQLRQEHSQRSVTRPRNREAEEQSAQGRPSTSRRLFVPTPAEHHQEYQVYSECRDRINHQRRERQFSPIHVQANLNDQHLEVLGPKSPPRRRYAEVGLEETDESDYVPTSLGTKLSRQSTTIGPSEPISHLPILRSASSFRKSIGSRKSRIRPEHRPGVSLNKEITPLLSFSGDVVEPIGSIQLPLAIGSGQRRAFIYTHFLVVSCPTAYNAIIGRPALTRMKAILSPHMLLLKFPTQSGISQVRGDQLSARVCYVSSTTEAANQTPRQGTTETLAVTHSNLPNGRGGTDPPDDPRDDTATPQAQPAEELETISLSDVQDRQVRIGTSLSPSLRSEFISFLRANSEVFAWSYDDMPGISPDVISHKLSINPSFKPVRQKRRSYDTERYEAMKAEVDKLQTIGFIREIRVLIDMRVPKTRKEVQSLTGRVAALARFISKATDRCAPFFKALRGSKRQIDWTSECDRAFDDLKNYMSRAPLLSVLIRQPNGIELPIFYMSHAL
ncbi:unnamed protein product [Prunus brigantina]